MTYTWQELKDNVVDGKTNLNFTRRDDIQQRYHDTREHVQTLNFRKYSDFIKVKHLAYKSKINADEIGRAHV